MEVEGDEERSLVFATLKSYSLQLLQILQNQNPNQNPHTISQFLLYLRSCSSHALQPFLDYTLFPLLLLLDSAVDCRSPRNPGEKYVTLSALETPPKVSDSVAEGVVQCLEELLKKCHVGSLDQMVVVMKKLTHGALLSPSEASEEFREGVIRCFKQLLLGLYPCFDETCSCKHIPGFPTLLEGRELQPPLTIYSKYDSEPKECTLLFLQSQAASAAVGHWLSLLLKAADTEATRGFRGSAKLRIESFLTLRVLVAKVGTADALAFFLPGVVSQFAKVLHISKTMISGASGSAEAYDQAIRGLAEFLMIVLRDANFTCSDDNAISDHLNTDTSQLFMEKLRELPVKAQPQRETMAEDSNSQAVTTVSPRVGFKEKGVPGSLHVNRTKDWIMKTSEHVDKLLCATCPHICVHPAKRVRQGLLAAINGLLLKCSYTLKGSRLMLLESLCVLVCDDSDEVSIAARESLEFVFSVGGKKHLENDIAEIFSRLVEKLPNVVFGSEESLAVSHAQKLLVLIYYSGPQFVVDHLLCSPVSSARFLDALALCLSQNSVFSGSLDKLLSAKPSSTGYLQSVAELKAITDGTVSEVSRFPGVRDRAIQSLPENTQNDYEIPRMPPWFTSVGSPKLYQALAGILRLLGLSVMADSRSATSLLVIIDFPLGSLRKLVSEVRRKDRGNESWGSWYTRTGSGQLLRQASTAVCILNEIIYGTSDQAVASFGSMFGKSRTEAEAVWKVCQEKAAKSFLIDCVGSILHEYQSNEVWNIPVEHKSPHVRSDGESRDFSFHFFRDTAMLHQVIIEGIGIFNLCLGQDFASSGFLHSSLYLLLENLIHSNFYIRRASDAVLHVFAATSGYPTVGHLVVANSDYVIDSLCRLLRHLDLNPHVPNVLASMLSYIGVAHKILPLLEEPMRSVSLELEILGRHQHPELTVPFLKAVAEIVKASKHEASSMPTQAESYSLHVKSLMSDVKTNTRTDSRSSTLHYDNEIESAMETEEACDYINDSHVDIEQWENVLFKLNDSKRYRRTVGSVAGSCLTTASPLLASLKESACLLALDIVEDGIATLAKVEEAYKRERKTKETIEEAIQMHSLYHLQDNLDAAEEGTDENRLLPAMNKLWPFLVVCVRNKNPVSARRCLRVVSNVVQLCGGDFFSRRFHTDGPHFWKLLSTSPFHKKSISKQTAPLQLPYRSYSVSSEDSMAEVSTIKVQVAVLDMIADLSLNKRSSSSLQVVLKKVTGLVVGIACSGVVGLRDAAIRALMGLASMDSDLVWLLLTDVYYSKKKNLPLPPISDLPEISQILPPPLSPKDYLYVQYGGQSVGFDIDISSVETVFRKLNSQVFTSQMYS